MVESPPSTRESLEGDFQDYEKDIRVRNYRMCGVLAMVFMLIGSSLDWIVYGEAGVRDFIGIRLGTAVVLGIIRVLLGREWGRRFHRPLGIAMAMPLIISMAWMIYAKNGSESPYYAGLNLVMLGAAVLMHWQLADSIIVVFLTLTSYFIACFANDQPINRAVFFNNVYFLFVTGVFTTAGTWFYNTIRFSEFQLRNDLDKNRSELESANLKLADNYAKLRDLDEVKNRFFANISHELRTPLTLLIAPLERLMQKAGALSVEDQRDLLATMQGNAMRLLKLINDLLALTRLQSGKVNVKTHRLNVPEFFRGMAEAVQGVAQDKHLTVQSRVAEDLDLIQTDPEKLERICLNLLFNAIKFTPEGGSVAIEVTKSDTWLVIEVRDTGIGIDPAHLPHIFGRFWQADTSSNRKFQGVGIGLALVKEFAEAMGGSVAATSAVGAGTTMTVRVPFVAAATMTVDQKPEGVADDDDWLGGMHREAALHSTTIHYHDDKVPSSPNGAHKPLLLVADDEPDMRHFLKVQLGEQFEVIEAADGKQAVEMALARSPDIILSDMMMPEKDGLQVCRELRASSVTRTTPIVLLTAETDPAKRIACLSAGASDFLNKPFSMIEVMVRLRNLVESSLYQQALATQKVQLEAALVQVKETEVLLVRNEKLASLGRMSAGLIHEINNPLNYARQGLYLLRDKARFLSGAEHHDYVDTLKDVEEGIDRVVRIVSDLRGFTRNTEDRTGSFDLSEVVHMTGRFFAHEFKDGIHLTVQIPDGLCVRGDSNHMVQVLTNLIQNAIDALRTKTFVSPDLPTITIKGIAAPETVTVFIRDNGPGVPDDIKTKIFDPFFTTKDVGAGMGLGLAVCHRIMTEHGGRIDMRSELGRFTEFVLEFPRSSAINTIE